VGKQPRIATLMQPPGETAIEPLPPDETGRLPVRFDRATVRWFGIAPAAALLLLAAAALGAAILLFALGDWPIGLVLVGAALLLLAAFGEAARRKPDAPFARRSFEAWRRARERAGVAVESAARRSRAQRELTALRHELLGIEERRRAKLVELGEAALSEDEEAVAGLRDEIGGLDGLAADKEAEMQATALHAREGIERARLSVQSTQMLEPAEPEKYPPAEPEQYPPSEPEEYPPPDEGNPPEPARIPEQYPPPDEGTPPQPVGRAGG
jgi:hypothetical protein